MRVQYRYRSPFGWVQAHAAAAVEDGACSVMGDLYCSRHFTFRCSSSRWAEGLVPLGPTTVRHASERPRETEGSTAEKTPATILYLPFVEALEFLALDLRLIP